MSISHKSLTPEKWRERDFSTQILNVAAELHRAYKALTRDDSEGAALAYARALELVDLTVATNRQRNLLRELLRWRCLVAEEYLNREKTPESSRILLKALLLFSAPSARQVPYLCPPHG